MPELPYRLDRTVVIRAMPETVFRFLTESDLWAKWWGPGSSIDPVSGGRVYVRHPNGVEVVGAVIEVHPPERIAFTYGYASGKPIAPGSSRVTILLEPVSDGTRLQLTHEFAEAGPRDQHVQGWRFQLSLFSNLVTDDVYANAADSVDAWFAAWTVADDAPRAEAFAAIAAPEVQFRDRYSALDGLHELTAHSGAAQRFMPGMDLKRKGRVRHCQGSLLADWAATNRDGQERMSGTSLFLFKPDGKIEAVTSFANA